MPLWSAYEVARRHNRYFTNGSHGESRHRSHGIRQRACFLFAPTGRWYPGGNGPPSAMSVITTILLSESVSRRKIREVDIVRTRCAQRAGGRCVDVACFDQDMAVDLPRKINRKHSSTVQVGIAGCTCHRHARANA